MKNYNFISLGAFTALAVVTGLFVSCGSRESADHSGDPLMLGTNVWPGYELFYVARDQGYLDADVVRMVECTSASQVISAFRDGGIDIAALTLDEVLLLKDSGLDLRVILVTDVSHGGDVILSKPEVDGVAGLQGRRVGVEDTALGAYVLTRALQQVELSAGDVKVVPLQVDEHQQAYEAGKVDAVVTFEPVRSKLLNAGAKKLFDSAQIPGEIVDVLVLRAETLETRRADVNVLLRAYFKTLAEFDADPKATAAKMVDRLKLAPDQALESFSGLKLPSLEENVAMLGAGEGSLREGAAKLAAIMQEGKLLREDADLSALFDPQPVKALTGR